MINGKIVGGNMVADWWQPFSKVVAFVKI